MQTEKKTNTLRQIVESPSREARPAFSWEACRAFVQRRLDRLGSWTDRDDSDPSLAAAVFALKSAFFLKMSPRQYRNDFQTFMETFRDDDDFYHDPAILEDRHLLGESRQALALAYRLELTPPAPRIDFEKALTGLDAKNPWSFMANLSHLMFFAKTGGHDGIVRRLFEIVENYREKDGLWGPRAASPLNRVNAAMKAIVFYRSGETRLEGKRKILNYILKHENEVHEACHDCDLALILSDGFPEAPFFKRRRIHALVQRLSELILDRQNGDGGFSYYEDHCQTEYYGQKISEPLPVSDIHGTHLYLWALAELSRAGLVPFPLDCPHF
jgi:hypothetical protein